MKGYFLSVFALFALSVVACGTLVVVNEKQANAVTTVSSPQPSPSPAPGTVEPTKKKEYKGC